MFIKETEKSKVNSSELSSYEAMLKEEELAEARLVREFDSNIETILGKTLYKYLKDKNLITPSFLVNFHFSDIPNSDAFKTKDGEVVPVRELFKTKATKFFKERTDKLRKEIEGKELKPELLDKYTPEAFALSSIALMTFHRKKDMKLRDVQKIAGFAMCYGEIAELGTGEGKTISAVAPAFFHALRGKGVHVVTANSYLSKRDYIELSPVYEGLGLTCGYVQTNVEEPNSSELKKSKKEAYRCDITYSPKDEVAFDYLRDSTAKKIEDVVTRSEKVGFAIVDEVDDALVDSANSPYVIAASPAVYKENMNILGLANAMSLPVDMVLHELRARGTNVGPDTTINYEAAVQIGDLFSKNIYRDDHDKLMNAQAYYTYLKRSPMQIRPADKAIFERYKNILSMENGIMRVNDARLYLLLTGEEQDLKSSSYYGPQGFDPQEIARLRKYARLVVCPTSNAYYINTSAFEDYLNVQFLADKEISRLTNESKDKVLKYLTPEDYTVNKKGEVNITPIGIRKIVRDGKLVSLFPKICSRYEKLINNKNEFGAYYYHILAQTIIANEMLVKNEDYTINNGEIVLLKNAREQSGSKYTNGLQQAIEIKEMFNGGKIRLSNENPSLASITQKDYYGRYEMFSGMTGTSAKKIFEERYNKSTVRIPRDSYYTYYSKRLRKEKRNSPIEPIGIEKRRVVFAKNNQDKFSLILSSIRESQSMDPMAPVLLVVSDPNELFLLEKYLIRNGLNVNVIENSRLGNDDKRGMESVKVAMAGRSGAVTLATMMAGRGTDIKLGGDRDTIIEFATNKTMREKNIEESARDEIRILCEESLVKQGIILTKAEEEKERRALERVGLKVISSGFFDSERIDRQLEGRTGRNGISGITERYSSPEDLAHLGLERVHDEPVLDIFSRSRRYGDGSLSMDKKDYDRLTDAIESLQKNKDARLSDSIKFTQDVSVLATDKLEEVRDKRRQMLEYTRDDQTLLQNEHIIKEEIMNMLTLTVDNLLVSYIGNNKFISNPSILTDGDKKHEAEIDYEGLRLACKETIGIDIDIDTFKKSDTSILEFRNALINYVEKQHNESLKKNKAGQLRRDVKAILHKDDHNISSINGVIDHIRKQKSFDYISGLSEADTFAVLDMTDRLKDLKCESCKAGSRLLIGRILNNKEKTLLEKHRKALFDNRIENNEVLTPLSVEDDSTAILTFRKIIKKFNEEALEEKETLNDEIVDKSREGQKVNIAELYQNLKVRPMTFMKTEGGLFTLVRKVPTNIDLLDRRKSI